MSQIKDDVEKLIKNVNEEYVSLCNNEYDYFKVRKRNEFFCEDKIFYLYYF